MALIKKVALWLITWGAAAILFLLTVYSLWLDRSATAAVSGALMVGLVLLNQLSIMESFEILSLKAKFVRRIDEAEDLLKRVRASAEVFARLNYWQVALGDRLSHMSWSQKRDLISDFDGLLGSLDIPHDRIGELKSPFLGIIALDLIRVLENSVSERLDTHRRRAQAELQAYLRSHSPISPGDPEHQRLLDASRKFEEPVRVKLEDARLSRVAEHADRWLRVALEPFEREKLEVVRSEILALSSACEQQQNVTPDTESYLEKFGLHTGARNRDLFAPGE